MFMKGWGSKMQGQRQEYQRNALRFLVVIAALHSVSLCSCAYSFRRAQSVVPDWAESAGAGSLSKPVLNEGMSEGQVRSMLGTPMSQATTVCGQGTARPWRCRVLEWADNDGEGPCSAAFEFVLEDGSSEGSWLLSRWSCRGAEDQYVDKGARNDSSYLRSSNADAPILAEKRAEPLQDVNSAKSANTLSGQTELLPGMDEPSVVAVMGNPDLIDVRTCPGEGGGTPWACKILHWRAQASAPECTAHMEFTEDRSKGAKWQLKSWTCRSAGATEDSLSR